MVLFLHGRGESGDDKAGLLSIGLPEWLVSAASRWPVAVCIPQKPEFEDMWPAFESQVLAHLDACVAELGLDPTRVVITGMSQGGHGTLHLVASQPGRFRAAAAVCAAAAFDSDFFDRSERGLPLEGYSPFGPSANTAAQVGQLADRLHAGRVPLRLFHGDADDIIPVACSEQVVSALRERGTDVPLVTYPGVGHNAWDAAYGESDLAEWLVQHLRDAEPTSS
jgi:dipeptidyl aminopeptidase/acylaminoacyl peptidase